MVFSTRERGVALLMAVVAVAFIAILAVAMLKEQNQLLRRVANNIGSQNAFEYAKSGEHIGAAVLFGDRLQGLASQQDYDFNESFLRQQFVFPIEDTGGTITAKLNELNGLFNVNNLIDDNGKTSAVALKSFKSLLAELKLAPELADYLADWLDKDDVSADGSLENNYYLNQPSPHLSANQPLLSLRELAQVRGFSEPMYDAYGNPSSVLAVLSPYITALPIGSNLNVNTADAKILQAYLPQLSKEQIQQLIQARPFANIKDFQNHPSSQIVDAKTGKSQSLDYKKILPLSVHSDYFALDSQVQIGRFATALYSIMRRNTQTGTVHVVLRIKGKI